MGVQSVEINCPGCGAPVAINTKVCEFCNSPVTVSTFTGLDGFSLPQLNKYVHSYQNSLRSNPDNSDLGKSMAFCLLKIGLYDQAIASFEKVLPLCFTDSELLFYYSVALLKGKKAFAALRPTIDKIETSLNSAISIEPKGIYYYFLAYIKYDYFFRKKFKTTPTYSDCLAMAKETGYSAADLATFYGIIKQAPVPDLIT